MDSVRFSLWIDFKVLSRRTFLSTLYYNQLEERSAALDRM